MATWDVGGTHNREQSNTGAGQKLESEEKGQCQQPNTYLDDNIRSLFLLRMGEPIPNKVMQQSLSGQPYIHLPRWGTQSKSALASWRSGRSDTPKCATPSLIPVGLTRVKKAQHSYNVVRNCGGMKGAYRSSGNGVAKNKPF